MSITAEQIPDEVVKEALWAWLTHTGNNDAGMRAAILAALSAWPGAEHQMPDDWSNKPHLILTLPQENK